MDTVTLTGNERAIIRQDLPEGKPEEDLFIFTFSKEQVTYGPKELWKLVDKWRWVVPPSLLFEALVKIGVKGEEHNSPTIDFGVRCIFGAMSAADFVHHEAVRLCVCAENKNLEGMLEHLVDIVVYSMLMWDFIKEKR